jgi:hypothetical protein
MKYPIARLLERRIQGVNMKKQILAITKKIQSLDYALSSIGMDVLRLYDINVDLASPTTYIPNEPQISREITSVINSLRSIKTELLSMCNEISDEKIPSVRVNPAKAYDMGDSSPQKTYDCSHCMMYCDGKAFTVNPPCER